MDGKKSKTGLPVKPLLLNLLMEEQMGRIKWGGVRLGSSRIYKLAYADNVLMTKEEEGMRSMLERLEGYLGKKGLELNVKKTKVMRF